MDLKTKWMVELSNSQFEIFGFSDEVIAKKSDIKKNYVLKKL
jgi:hypothetical protein